MSDDPNTAPEEGLWTRAVVHEAVDGVITVDDNGILEYINPAAERVKSCSVKDNTFVVQVHDFRLKTLQVIVIHVQEFSHSMMRGK